MAVIHEPKCTRRNRLRFSLRTLLVFALLVSAYFAGRAPMMHRAQRAEQERDEYRRLAEQREAELVRLSHQLSLVRQYVVGRLAAPDVDARTSNDAWVTPSGRMTIDAGMMADALEHQQRYFSTPPTGMPR